MYRGAMSTAFLTRARALATRQIAKFGATVTLTRVTAGAYDSATETRAADVVESVAVKAVMTPYTPLLGVSLGLSFEQAAAILTSGSSFQIAADGLAFAPEPGMKILGADGRENVLAAVVVNAPDGVPIVYTCAGKSA